MEEREVKRISPTQGRIPTSGATTGEDGGDEQRCLARDGWYYGFSLIETDPYLEEGGSG